MKRVRSFVAPLVGLALVASCHSPAKTTAKVPEKPAQTAQKKPAPAPTPPEPARGMSRAPGPQEALLIRELMRDTERIRGLAFRAPIDIRIQDRTAMRAFAASALEEHVLARARRRYVALGLLDPAIDVRALLESVMEEELIGYYDPKLKRLAVRDDVARSLGARSAGSSDLEWRATVVHELVHALQDQHLGLAQAMDVERTTDADDAFGALIEGDATLAMLGYAGELNGNSLKSMAADPRGLAASLHAAPERFSAALRAAPAVLREPLLFRYRDGTLFAAKLFHTGGWEQVDAAHLTPPESTLSVLEPAHYLHQDATPRLTLPDLSWLVGSGYERIDEDVLGSFEIAVVLGDAGISPRTLQASWRGDRYALFERDDVVASAWFLCFDTKAITKRSAAAFESLGSRGQLRHVTSEGSCLLVSRGLDAAADEELARRFRAWARGEQP